MTKLRVITHDASFLTADAVAILVFPGQKLSLSGKKLDQTSRKGLGKVLLEESFLVKNGRVLVYYAPGTKAKKIFAVASENNRSRKTDLREAAYHCIRSAQEHGASNIVLAFDPQNPEETQAIAEGALLGTYRYEEFKELKNLKPAMKMITVCGSGKNGGVNRAAEVLAQSSFFVRDLVNQPPNLLRPVDLAEVARKTAKKHNLQVRIFQPQELAKMGANAFLSVGKGNDGMCRMVHLQYKPAGKSKAHVAIVGKGITFDSGGLSLKPEKALEHMKADMAGAAIVLACLRAASELKLPVQLTGLMMAVENMPDGGANRPGDVVTAMNGKTIEIVNTDAEGRLALADGLVYAQKMKPDYLLDVATLTGAQVISLGRLIGMVMGNDETLIKKITDAGERAGEVMWPVPLFEPYRSLIKSDTADIRNSSGIAEASAIQAGLFLSEFVNHPRWAHLDIAGPTWQEREWDIYTRNASGFGARCILSFLMNL